MVLTWKSFQSRGFGIITLKYFESVTIMMHRNEFVDNCSWDDMEIGSALKFTLKKNRAGKQYDEKIRYFL